MQVAQTEAEPERTFRDLVKWRVYDRILNDSKDGLISIDRLYDIDPVKDTMITSCIREAERAGVIRITKFGVRTVNPLQLAVMKARQESRKLKRQDSFVNNHRGIWQA